MVDLELHNKYILDHYFLLLVSFSTPKLLLPAVTNDFLFHFLCNRWEADEKFSVLFSSFGGFSRSSERNPPKKKRKVNSIDSWMTSGWVSFVIIMSFNYQSYFVLLIKSHLQSYPCPLQINSFWNLGFLLGITIILQIITGIFLGLHYTSDLNSAYSSLFFLIREIFYGWCLRYLHSSGASFVFLFLFLHLASVSWS